jgi:hypothetical protein
MKLYFLYLLFAAMVAMAYLGAPASKSDTDASPV